VSARRLVLGLVIGAAALAGAGTAQAYPQWQLSTGTSRCNQCHYAPAGGGLINSHGRDASGEDLSTWDGNGGFLHGAVTLPDAVALGFDGRYAALLQDVGEKGGAKLAQFPMQADATARFAFGEAVSLYLNVGYRGQARSGEGPVGAGAPQPVGGSVFISREHWLMWRPAPIGPYVRAGRFFTPFGLRLAEHYTYVRRDNGLNLLQETYNVSGGVVQSGWELHVTAFGPDFLRQGNQDKGAAAMYELRLGEASALGLQTRAAFGPDASRYTGGAFGKTYVEVIKLLVQAEVDVAQNVFASGVAGTQSMVGYLGLTLMPGKGFWITPFGERVQTSLAVKNSATNAGGLQLNWFPYPHFELTFMGRVQQPAGGSNATTALLFLHYYL
jgi:hypothetical protein